MRLACWVALGACVGCSSEDTLGPGGPDAGGSAGAMMAMGARAGTTMTGSGGTTSGGSGGSGTGGSGNAGSGNGGSGNATSGSGGSMPSGVGVSVLASCTDRGAVGTTWIRRISQLEYANAVRDLFGVTIDRSDLPSDELLENVFTANVTTPLTVDQFNRYDTKAKSVATEAAPALATAAGAEQALVGLARRAFHGVLEPADQKTLEDLYTQVAADDATLAASTAIRFMLDSPRFLFVVEFGTPEGNLAKLTPGEVAGRLASFLWRSVPDTDLLAAADAGTLGTADGIRAQAMRMFDDARARPVLEQFVHEWLDLGTTGGDATALALDAETGATFTALAQGTGTYGDLWSSTRSQGPAELAAFYGVTAGADGTLTLPPERAGLLLRGGFQRSHVKGSYGSPTQRGKVVRQAILCDPVALPSGTVDMTLPDATDGQTTQDVFDEHAANAYCKGCHALMDPIGAAFGSYGSDGRFDPALTRSTAGSIYAGGANTFEAEFADTAGLMSLLAENEVPKQCFTIQAARFALGRSESNADACGLSDIWQGFQAGSLSLRTLFVEVATSSLMQTRNIVKAEEACE